jgi:uncharacterized protein
MEEEVNSMADLMVRVLGDVLLTLERVWPFLLISVLTAASIAVYAGAERTSRWLGRRAMLATVGAVALATLTPFCSCGTTAVLLGMLATSAPWAPLVAFMVASPLTSPSELIFSAGLFGWGFALVFFVGTIVLGLTAGAVAGLLDRAGWLRDQARVRSSDSCATGACRIEQPVRVSLGPGAASVAEFQSLQERLKVDELAREIWRTGRKLLIFFLAFTFVGYLAIEAIPTMWLTGYLGEGSALGVPLAAVLGIPVYINTEASLPLVAAMMEGGMGPGPAMAFLVTGAGTSVGAISGLFVIARKRVVALVVVMLLVGSLALGWFSQLVF